MHMKNWKTEILTIPNLLSLFRLAVIPVYMTFFLNAENTRQYCAAGTLLTVSCITDAVDGKIARRFHMVSTAGKILDPLADKLTQFSLMLCLSFRYRILFYVLILFAIKEIFQLTLGIINLQHNKILPGALPEGKICTAVLFSSLIFLVFFPDISRAAVNTIAAVNTFFLTVSFAGYYLAYFGNHAKLQDLQSE